MPDISHDKLAALARAAGGNNEIEAMLGRKMKPDELRTVWLARLAMKAERAVKRQRGPIHDSDKHTIATAERSKVDRVPCADPARRKRLEADDAAWMRWYCAESFFLPFEKPHKAIIEATREAIIMGRDTVIAAERGVGKSYIEYALVMKLALSGEQAFPVYLPWGEKNKAQGFGFWLDCLAFNERIADDYPEVCAPFVHARGVPQRVATTTWRDTGEPTHARIAGNAGIIVFPDARGVIGSSTINGNPRGLNYKHKGGKSVRPTMAFVDDVQDDKVAHSKGPDGLVGKTIRTVNGAVRGLKRAGASFSIIMTGNCIEPGDVMEHFLNQAGWTAVRVSCVERWPDGWDEAGSEGRKLADEWGKMWLAGDRGEAAFFRKHKGTICKGMVLNSPRAYMHGVKTAAQDKRNKRVTRPVNACHAVLREYYTMGHEAFMAERQQAPQRRAHSIYLLSTEIVQSRAQDRAPGVVPDWAQTVIAATDINPSYALTSVVVAFGAHQTGAVCWYGLYTKPPLPVPKEATEIEKRRIIYEALAIHGKQLAALPCRPKTWFMDGGGSPEGCVIQFAANAPEICGLPAWCTFGRGWKNYRPTSRKNHKLLIGEQLHRVTERLDRQWIIYNADYWREIAQRGWTGEPGAPGSCSLPHGRHEDFAAQVCREQLRGKDEIGGRMVWVWDTQPGPHDFGDCMQIAYMGAAAVGIGTEGMQQHAKPKQSRWKRKNARV